jgi:diguanylate cyclase (GGDEF)-like protein
VSKPQLLLVGQPQDFEERLAMLLPGVNVVATRDFAHAASFGKPDRLDVVLFEVAVTPGVLPPVLQTLSTPQTVWAATLRGAERPNFRAALGIEVKRIFPDPVEPEHVARSLSTLLRAGVPTISLDDHKKAAVHQARHAELLQIFLSRSRSRLGAMLAAVASGQVEAMRQVLAIDAHRMVGTLGTFGYPSATEPARTLEELFSKEEPLSQQDLDVITAAAKHILELLADDESQVLVPQQASGPTVCLLSPNDFLRMEFSARAPEYGFRAIAPPLSGFTELLASSHQFDMTVFDFGDALPDPTGPLQQVVDSVNCSVLALCPKLSLQERFELSKLNLDTVVEGPLKARALADLVARRLRSPAGSRVVALDDDRVYLANLEAMLRPLELNFQATESPEDFWLALETRKPDLVVLDIDMPRFDGLQVCRAIKTNPRFEDLPVIFVSSKRDPATRQQAFSVGGDDYLEKPVNAQELRIRIVSRLRRSRAAKEVEVDELTGLMNRQTASKALEQILALASLRTLPMAVTVSNLDQFKLINDRYGRSAGDMVMQCVAELLKESLRPEDVVAHWGGDEFVTGMFLTDREGAKEKLDEVLTRLQSHTFKAENGAEFQVTFSTGVAQYPMDGATVDSVYQAADRALSMAKLRGRARTVKAAAAKKLSEPVDVIIVEDDHPLGEVVVFALESEGYNTVWFQDAEEARQAMLSEAPYLTCKVMLIDKGLGVDDGLALIREIKDAGRLGATCIITCSARMSDQEVQMGFDLGTFEHISKPFSMPAVLRAVKRGIEHYRYHGLTPS